MALDGRYSDPLKPGHASSSIFATMQRKKDCLRNQGERGHPEHIFYLQTGGDATKGVQTREEGALGDLPRPCAACMRS
jgi:hypothetical protein